MKHLLLTLICMLFALGSTAQGTGQWAYHLAYQDCADARMVGDEIYALMAGNLMCHNLRTDETRFIERGEDGLSDKGIAYLDYSPEEACLLLVYENKNIDLLYPTSGAVLNIPQVKNYVDEEVVLTHASVSGMWATLCTTQGVILLNLERAEVSGYYKIGRQVNAAAVLDDVVLCATDAGLYQCSLDANPFDATQWHVGLDANYITLRPFAGGLLAPCRSGDARGVNFLTLSDDGTTLRSHTVTHTAYSAVATNEREAVLLTSDYAVSILASDPTHSFFTARTDTTYKFVIPSETAGEYWGVDGFEGLVPVALDADTTMFSRSGEGWGGYGPRRDLCYRLRVADDRLLVAGSRFDYGGKLHYEPTALIHEDGTWLSLQEEGVSALAGITYRDVNDIIQDPHDEAHHFVSTGGQGIYEFRDFQYVKRHSAANSGLEDVFGGDGYTRIGGLAYDADGNLWMANYLVDSVLRVMKPDQTWVSLYYEQLKNAVFIEHLFFDTAGRLWLTMPELTNAFTSGLTCIELNGTPYNASDDRLTFRSSAVNEDGTAVSLNYVNDITEDLSGQLWVSTAEGVFVVEKPEDYALTSFTILQPKVPRNDGTNYADYLLSGVNVACIAVDGANRKWCATRGSGLYLVSENGQEVLEHFTAANSPLLSDVVNSLALEPATGLLWIGTEAGLCSYRTASSEPAERLSKSNIVIAPNPVRPDYQGLVAISGLTDGAEVRIMTTGGQLVCRGTANGGTFAWDCCDSYGRRVATGVYYLLITTAEGSDYASEKIVVI